MSWQTSSVMQEKLKFIRAWQSGAYTMTELCKRFSVSRTTGYKLVNRFKEEGSMFLEERSKRPHAIPHKTSKEIEAAIVELRNKHKDWGARKIRVLLLRQYLEEQIPSEKTINKIMSAHGLVKKRKRRMAPIERRNPKYIPSQCNEIWGADYKGEFKIGNRRYCYPLTLTDKCSRYLLANDGHYHPDYKSVRSAYVKAFRCYGKPQYIHSDNGSPFGSIRSVCRYSSLSYWLIDHGIEPLYSDPGCPQQNGRHERMHKDLKAYCNRRIRNTLAGQQRVLDSFRKEYNEVRPHESLGMETPASQHVISDREYRSRIRRYDYDLQMKVLTVMKSGAIRWGHEGWVFVSQAARGRKVGLEEIGNGIWQMFYRNVFLGYFDEKLIYEKDQYLKLTNSLV